MARNVKREWIENLRHFYPEECEKYVDKPGAEVEIIKSDECGPKGKFLWAVVPCDDPEFWFDSFSTKKEAVALCKLMGWKRIRKVRCGS